MAITRSKKEAIIEQTKTLWQSSKLTLAVHYRNIPVAYFQLLRFEAEAQGITVKVVKNRLVKKILADLGIEVSKSDLRDSLVYVFSPEDEAAGAQLIQKFIKRHKLPLKFVQGFLADGSLMAAEEVSQLASLPDRQTLFCQLLGNLEYPHFSVQNNLNLLPNILSNLAHK